MCHHRAMGRFWLQGALEWSIRGPEMGEMQQLDSQSAPQLGWMSTMVFMDATSNYGNSGIL